MERILLWGERRLTTPPEEGYMLFLVRSEATIPPTTSMEEIAPELLKSWELLERYQREGKIVAGGRVSGTRFAYFIVDVDSPEALDQMFANSPLYNYVDLEVMPLTPISSAFERMKEWARTNASGSQGSEQTEHQGQWPTD